MKIAKYKLTRRAMLLGVFGAAGTAALIGGATAIISSSAEPAGNRGEVTLYRNPECGCCEAYADYLRGNGFTVRRVSTYDLASLDAKYGIPSDHEPCHIALIGGYVVGGLVPIEIVDRLLSEKPQITGITLPGMPTGVPGMPGTKRGPLQIYEIAKGSRKVYAVV